MKKHQLPATWSWKKLDDVSETIVDGPFGSNLKTSDYVNDGIPVLQGKNITNNQFQWFDVRYITEKKAESLARSKTFLGDHLLIKIGSIGYSAILDYLNGYPFAIIPANMAKITPNRDMLDDRFLHRWLTSIEVSRHLQQISSKTAQPALSLRKIKNTPIPLPPLHEQKRIAVILDKADELRAKRRRALARLDDLLQSVFLEMFGDPVTNPKGWKSLSLDEVLIRPPQNGAYFPKDKYTDEPDGVEMVHMSDAFYDILHRGNLRRVKVSDADVEKYGLASNDILIARRSLNYEGAAKPCRIPPSNEPLIFESSLIRISPDHKTVTTDYLYYYLANEVVRRAYVFPHVTKSTISGINQSGLKRIKVIVPPMDKQIQFDRFVSRLLTEKERLNANLTQFDNLFHSLQQRAFKGELTSPTSTSQ